MPDTDSSDDDDPSIDSDSDIYSVIGDTSDGVVIDENASPVEKPTIHNAEHIARHQESGLFDEYDVDGWMVGQASTGSYQVWVPVGEAEITVENRLELSDPQRTVRVDHSLRTPWIDEVYMISDRDVRDRVNYTQTTPSSQYPHQRIDSPESDALADVPNTVPERRPYDSIDTLGNWLHGTDPDDGATWEIFVPVEDATVEIMNDLFLVEWHENAILRRNRGDGFNITEQQDGLRCRQLFTVDERRVPFEPEGSQRETDAVDRYETRVDMIGDSS
jgi:hypothetical protein